MSEEFERVVANLKSRGEMLFVAGAESEQIKRFEEEEGVVLPTKYKEWLLFSDGGDLFLPAGFQLYGVSHKPVIDVDDADRPNSEYIVIGALSTGDPILCRRGCEQISIYNHEAGVIEDDEVYDDFLALLKDAPELLGIEA